MLAVPVCNCFSQKRILLETGITMTRNS
uniref:Uncharacterized protein n=1 Tax=Anguilla anguilla TaxID=7936 RepID=A0A0E9TR04_ANGAN